MVQLHLLSGKRAGTTCVARQFPFRIGRAPTSDLRVAEEGVGDRHLELRVETARGVVLQAGPEALTTVNGQRVRETVLRNGDVIGLGALTLRFWLAESPQSSLRWREALTWVAWAAVCLGQGALIYWLQQ